MNDEMLDEKTHEFAEKYFGAKDELGEEEGTENVGEEGKLGGEDDTGEGEEVREGEKIGEENDTKTMSSSSSNKRNKEDMSIDRLSALPDSLILHILSLLGCGLKEAAITCVLSKRWRCLWSNFPSLRFYESSKETEKIRKFVAWVNRTLAIRNCSENYLEYFMVEFKYDKCFASDVDVWVEFAVKNKVKDVTLLLISDEDFYTLPEIMYSNSSLTHLWVRGCIISPSRTIQWQSLTKLHIEEVELLQHVIEKILSGCPVLYSLDLDACWGFSYLEINSHSLYELKVSDFGDVECDPLLEISAPYVRFLKIWMYPMGRKFRLTNIPSVAKAFVNLTGYDWDSSSMEVMSNARELYEDIQHVKELDLGHQLFEVLSMLVVNGWQLPRSRRGCLTVTSFGDDEHNISGILGLLESSPNLETLVIDGFETTGESITWDPPAKDDMDCDLLHLKSVKIKKFAEPYLGGEPMLTLARILLKRAKVLEEMVILTDIEDTDDFVKMGQTLLAYPRSSQKAVILFP